MKSGRQPESVRSTGSLTLELYVRSLSPSGLREQQHDVVEQLEQLAARGTIDTYDVEVWGRKLAEPDAARTGVGRRIHDRVREFREWADGEGMSLESFFPVEPVRSEITGEEYTCIRFPTVALAEYEGDDLRFVSPCSDGATIHTVVDRLDRIAAAPDALGPLAAEGGVDEE